MSLANIRVHNIFLKSLVLNKLKSREIKEICKLKNCEWKFGLISQYKWFKDNIKKNDIHNLLYLNSKLIGYTLLRKRTCIINNSSKKSRYLLLDTIIIDKKFRREKLSKLLMNFNNLVIKKSKLSAFLICGNQFIDFYKKFDWRKISQKHLKIKDYDFSSNGMTYNESSAIKSYIFYTKK